MVEPKPETPPEPGRLDALKADELPPPGKEAVETLRFDPVKETPGGAVRDQGAQPTTEPPLTAAAPVVAPRPVARPVVASGAAPPSGREQRVDAVHARGALTQAATRASRTSTAGPLCSSHGITRWAVARHGSNAALCASAAPCGCTAASPLRRCGRAR